MRKYPQMEYHFLRVDRDLFVVNPFSDLPCHSVLRNFRYSNSVDKDAKSSHLISKETQGKPYILRMYFGRCHIHLARKQANSLSLLLSSVALFCVKINSRLYLAYGQNKKRPRLVYKKRN